MVNNFGMKKALIILFFAIVAGTTSAWAQNPSGSCGEHLTWEYNTSTGALTISGYGDMDFAGGTAPWSSNNGNIKSISLPDGLTSIGNSAFYFCSLLTSITIPAGVTSIGENAFLGCSGLTSISIPSSVTSIGYQAFSDCTNLNLINIPASVTGIGDNAFYGCSALAYITIDSNNTVFDSRNDCNAIIETSTNKLIVGCRNTVIPNSVTSIGNFAFFGRSGLNSISIPASVTSIGGSAFQNCSLKSITIPSSVTSIGDYAFYKCTNLKEVYVNWNTPPTPGTDAFKNISFEATLHVPYGTSANYTGASWSGFVNIVQMNPTGQCGDNLFWEYDPTTFILTISGTGDMYDYATYGTKPWHNWQNAITSVVLPDGLTNIGAGAFYGCQALTSINIPNGLLSIGQSAFNSCKALPSIDIPSTVTSIGVSAFANCWVLTSIEIPSGVTAIGANTFNSCKALTSFDIPANVTSIGVAAFMNCQLLESITIPANVTEIGTMAFKDCPQLADIYVGWTSTPPTPGNDAFDGLDLSNINLHVPDGTYATYAATAPWNAFNIVDPYGGKCGDNLYWSYNPTSHTLTITGTGDMYNYNNTTSKAPWYENYKDDITTVVLPNGMTSIGDYAFLSAQITSFTLPSSITSIGNSVFHSCPMTDVYVSFPNPTAITLATGAFNSNKSMSNVNLHVPAGTYALYAAADGWKKFNIIDPIGGKCGANLVWSYNSSTTTLTFTGSGDMYSYAEDKVPWKDYKPYITSIVLPEGLTIIGGQAFQGCTSLPSIDIPSSATMIYGNAFNGCTNLETVTFAGSNLTLIGGSAFKNCSSLTSINLPTGMTTISGWAFYGCSGLTSVTIPETLKTIANYAFDGCTGLTEVHFADNSQLTTIGQSAFYNCISLTSIDIPSSVTTISTLVFSKCTSLTSVNIPAGVTIIGDQAFRECTGLQSVSLPETLTSIGPIAFVGCTSLQSITIPNGITSIEDGTFSRCSSLTEITIPSNVETIGDYAFNGCTGLTDIYVPWTDLTGLTTKPNAFGDLTLSGINLHVPYGKKAVYAAAEPWSSFNIIDPAIHTGTCGVSGDNLTWEYNEITAILTISGTGAMYDYYSSNDVPWKDYKAAIQTVVVENGATSIGDYAFFGSTALQTVTIADGSQLTNINRSAFAECTNLTSINIPNSVNSIGESAFYVCSSLTSVTIPEGMSIIRMYTFIGCTSLTSVTIPNSVTRIYNQAFKDCTGLQNVYFADGSQLTNIEERAFNGCTGLQSITIPASVTSLGYHAFRNCTSLQNVYFADGINLTSIGSYAFQGCSALTSITIPEGVFRIYNQAFKDCTGLSTVIIPSSVEYIENFSFQNCTGLTDVTVNWTNSLPSTSTAFNDVDIAAVNLHLPFAAWSNYETSATWSGFKHVPVVTAKADPNNADTYYNTFYHGTKAYELPAGVEAYKAKRNGGDLELTKVAEAGDVLPADAAVILKSSVASYELVPSDAGTVTVEENDLQGVDAATPVATAVTSGTCYVLSGPNPSNTEITEVGFYTFSGTLGAHKAYVVIPGSGSSSPAPQHLRFVFDGEQTTTDIESPSLQGRSGEASKILRDGQLIIIRNGVEYNANGQMVR